jgi:ribonuclease HII
VIGGMDEAGRGPVFGPMVLAGVAVEDQAFLKEWGCKDSKLLSPDRRSALHRRLTREPGVKVEVRSIPAEVLDEERRRMGLNEIELVRFRDIGRALGVPRLVVDAADVDAERFGRNLKRGLKGVTVVSEHKADVNHPVVGAASIVAKVERDAAVAELGRRLERRLSMPLGSGYASDPLTIAFLTEWHARFGDLPEGTRRSWATIRDLTAPKPVPLDRFVGAIVEKPSGGSGSHATPAPAPAKAPKAKGRTQS